MIKRTLPFFILLFFNFTVFSQSNEAKKAYNEGIKSYTAGQYDAAIPHFKKVTNLDPKFDAPYRLIAICYDELGKKAEAVNYYKKVLNINPRQEDVYYNIALIHYSQKDYKSATVALNKAINIKPNYQKAKALLASLAPDKNSANLVAKATSSKNTQNNNSKHTSNQTKKGKLSSQAIALINKGATFYNNKDFKTAIKHFDEALLLGENPKIYTFIARAELHINKTAAAILNLKKALAIEPANADAHFYLSKAYEQNGNESLASRYAQNAKKYGFSGSGEKFNSVARGYYNKGVQLHKSKQYDEAIAYYKKAIQANSKNAKYHYNLGVAFYETKRLSESKVALLKSLDVAPQHVKANILLGNVYYASGQMKEAGAYLEAAVNLGSDDGYVFHNLGNIYNFLNNPRKAIQNYLESVKLNPEVPDFSFNLGITYHKTGRNSEAVKYLKKTVALDPSHKKALQNLVIVLIEMKVFDEAEIYGKKLIAADKYDGESYYLMGLLFDRKRDFKQKNEYMKAAQDLGYKAKRLPIN